MQTQEKSNDSKSIFDEKINLLVTELIEELKASDDEDGLLPTLDFIVKKLAYHEIKMDELTKRIQNIENHYEGGLGK